MNSPPGETLSVPERVIVAPVVGTFHGLDDPNAASTEGYRIDRGDVVGVIRSLGNSTPIHSPFGGVLVAMLAREGERVRPGQPVAWLRTTKPGRNESACPAACPTRQDHHT